MPEEREERDQPGDMETIDLNGKPAGGSQQPTLAFMQQNSSDSQQEDKEANSASAAETPVVDTQVEGTVQKTRVRTRSGNLGLKEWGSHQLKITKQLVQERFGHGVRTVDSELEHRLESLKETQKKYSQLMTLARQFQTHFSLVVDTQKSLAEHFAFMSVRAPELHTEFHLNSETQKVISRNGEALLAAMKHFSANMNTITSKTMEDTLQTAKGYDQARLAYDAYRSECESLQKQAATSQKAASNLTAMSGELEKQKKKFEQFRHDIDIKLKLLDENKVRLRKVFVCASVNLCRQSKSMVCMCASRFSSIVTAYSGTFPPPFCVVSCSINFEEACIQVLNC